MTVSNKMLYGLLRILICCNEEFQKSAVKFSTNFILLKFGDDDDDDLLLTKMMICYDHFFFN